MPTTTLEAPIMFEVGFPLPRSLDNLDRLLGLLEAARAEQNERAAHYSDDPYLALVNALQAA
jgi:hypothetical protein